MVQRPESGGPRGFTLVELMIVVAIVLVLSAIAVPLMSDYQLRVKVAEVPLNVLAIGETANV